MFTLKVEKRNQDLKAKQLRRTGFVPGCIYGKNIPESLQIQIKQSDVAQLLKANTTGSRVELKLGRKKYAALIKEISRNAVINQIEHLNFQELVKGETVTSEARIVLLNREKITDLVNQSLFEITYKAIPSKLVDKIEIDLDGMKTGSSVKVEDLDIAKDEDIELLTPHDSLVLSIVEPRRSSSEQTEEIEEEEIPGE